ncbi:MAG: pyridoxamine 5-phosphate oxidase [Acidobacteria bacterium]|nr:pyridoxamine 5-phosphate oxidase [Acidobacteriota bacterium]
MANRFHEIAFTPAVKKVQEKYGTRKHYAKSELGPDKNYLLGDAESDFIASRDGFYFATAGETGHPYIQFRGGPRGFLKVLDETKLGFADFRGNLQYISVGNLQTNARAALFLMDYANRRRLKILATVEIFEADERPDLIKDLADTAYEAKIERAVIFNVEAFEWNCPQHITPKYSLDEVRVMIRPLNEHIERLEKEVERLKASKK